MKNHWLKCLTAWLLSALLAVSPALAEFSGEWETDATLVSECFEAEYLEAGEMDLPGDDAAEETPEPEATLEPTASPTPEVSIEPEATVEPEATAEPEATTEPEATAEPEATDAPEVSIEPEETVEPEVSIEPEETVEPEVSIEPEETPVPAVEAEESSAPTAQPTETPAPTPEPTVQAEETVAPRLAAAAPTLELSAGSVNLGLGEKYTLTAVRLPEGASGASYQSSDPGIAAVDAQSGQITALALGSAVITVTAGDAQAACAVNVLGAPGKLSLSKSKLTLGVGQTYALTGTLLGGTASQITWKSSRPAVAAVDANGNITARGRGTAKITGQTFNGKKASCTVTVKPAPKSMSVTLDAATYSVGMRRTLTVKLTKGSKAGIAVTSSDSAVVSVDNRTITAAAPGTATVTVQTHNGLTKTFDLTVVAAPATAALPEAEISMGKGEKRTLTPVYDAPVPADVTWKSSSPRVVSVSAAGRLKAKARGSAVITMTTHNGLTASCTVRVVKAPSKVSLAQGKKLSMGLGETVRLTAKLPSGAESKLTWTSSAPGVATVDADGLVTAVGTGSAKITVKTFNGKKAACRVTVLGAPSALGFAAGNQILGVGMTADLKPAVNAGSAANIALFSDNPGVAAVSGGRVTAVAPGVAVITAATYNGLSAATLVTVRPAPSAVSMGYSTLYVAVGERIGMSPLVDEGSATAFTYKSADKKIATVSAQGVVKGKKTGTTTVTVKTHNGLKAKVKVRVSKAPSRVTLTPATLNLSAGNAYQLNVSLPGGTSSAIAFESSDPHVATVDAGGLVYAVGVGSATVTAATFNNKTAVCQVTVTAAEDSGQSGSAGDSDASGITEDSGLSGGESVPEQPGSVWQSPLGSTGLTVSWAAVSGAAGYHVYVGPEGGAMELYGDYDADVTTATIRGLTPGVNYRVSVTAYSAGGESDASAVNAEVTGREGDDTLTIDGGSLVLLALGKSCSLKAVSSTGSTDGIDWTSTSASILTLSPGGESCTVNGASTGTATVSAEMPSGASAYVTITVVDTSDLSVSNFNAVQKVLLTHDELINGDAGGNVIWDMVSARLLNAGFSQERVDLMISSLKSADATYRNLYLYSFTTYEQIAQATVDKHGDPVTVSNFDPADNTLYLAASKSYTTTNFAYVAFHESGHAVDWNADGNSALNSLNADATAAVLSDVRNVLAARLDAAIVAAEVDAANVTGSKVLDALMDYRTLLNLEDVLANLNADERKVYTQLSTVVKGEMNSTLPINNGCMVWDSIEGATNYAVSGSFGHAYLLNNPTYKEAASYYFYDRKGNPVITTEPWAEFFSSNIMGDSDTLSLNWSYLPQTCKYFAETFAPKLLSYFVDYIKSL